MAWTATNQLRTDLVAHCLDLDMAFHKEHTSGEMIERIDGDVNVLSNFFSKFVVYLLGNIVLMIGVLLLLFQIDWHVGLAVSTFALIALFILIVSHRRPVLQRADHIIVLKEGHVEAEGTLDELLETCEEMQRLWSGDVDRLSTQG